MVCPPCKFAAIRLTSRAAWPGQLDNQPVRHNMTLDRDNAYMTELLSADKTYMAPVSPWCKLLLPTYLDQ